MGTVKGNWLTGAHSGSACRHEDIYTKVNKKTGKCYSVKLCNPYSGDASAAQTAQMTKFGKISSALTSWINTNKETGASGNSAYQTVKAAFDRQTKYSTLRGYMMAKNMAAVQNDGSVVITVGSYSATVSASGSGGSSSSTTYSVNLTASPSEGGSVGSGQATATAGSTVRITASPNTGYSFTKWSDNNTSATRDIVVNSDVNLTAIFTLNGGGVEE